MFWKSALLSIAVAMMAPSAIAQEIQASEPPRSTCIAVAENQSLFRKASLSRFETRITYVAHSSFRIEDASGFAAVTDFAGLAGRGKVPDVVTMNRAHITHYTNNPNPKIPHVLRGWGENENPAKHNIKVGDVVIRNVTTDIRSQWTGSVPDGNSIFVFEMNGLCIAHLGHLHQLLSDKHYAALGRIDILMVPVDGGYTMNVEDMAGVVKALNARMVIPMHWFSTFSLQNFLTAMEGTYPVRRIGGSSLTVSLNDLPSQPTITVLTPETFFDIGD